MAGAGGGGGGGGKLMWGAVLVFAVYLSHSLYSLSMMFVWPSCPGGGVCLTSHISPARGATPAQTLYFFTSTEKHPTSREVERVFQVEDFDFHTPQNWEIPLDIPRKTRKNGTMYFFVTMADKRNRLLNWNELEMESPVERIPLVVYDVPKLKSFNLLSDREVPEKKVVRSEKPIAHFKSKIAFSALADPVTFDYNEIPVEVVQYIRMNRKQEYLPIIQYNFLKSRMEDLVEIKKNESEMTLKVEYAPASIGKIKFLVHISLALKSLNSVGFTEKNIDEVKEVLADTNLYILCATLIISSVHLLFDILAFKNDISFWRSKKSMVGLSLRTVLWRAFSQSIITLYLLDENSSILIIVPCVVSTFIELWKVKKMLRITFKWKFWKSDDKAKTDPTKKLSAAELKTREVDAEAMRYLSYLLYPICLCGAVYSLIYEPHKSWYSWTLHSLVNGVYAFGFLFMLPQLFINYKLKSVAALPWRAFMYKAFNTFIDDVFAFIITMPVAHRVACFRDDVVFLIYLYQRWLYPVDKSRTDDTTSIEETLETKDLNHEKSD